MDRKWRLEAARLHRLLDEPSPADPVRTASTPPAAPPHPQALPLAAGPTLARVMDRLTAGGGPGAGEELAARLTGELAREQAARRAAPPGPGGAALPGASGAAADPWIDGCVPLFPPQPARSGREVLADHVAAMVCCAAVDTAGATPGLDWLDGPALLVGGRRAADLATPVLSLVEDGDAEPLLAWLGAVGVRSEKPVRLA